MSEHPATFVDIIVAVILAIILIPVIIIVVGVLALIFVYTWPIWLIIGFFVLIIWCCGGRR